jgi:hypothetical protein
MPGWRYAAFAGLAAADGRLAAPVGATNLTEVPTMCGHIVPMRTPITTKWPHIVEKRGQEGDSERVAAHWVWKVPSRSTRR